MEITRTSIDELRKMIEAKESVTIVDVRQPAAYAESDKKIPSALYLDPGSDEDIETFAKTHATDNRIIFY